MKNSVCVSGSTTLETAIRGFQVYCSPSFQRRLFAVFSAALQMGCRVMLPVARLSAILIKHFQYHFYSYCFY
ncbi:MAG: hypothetical protein RugAbin2_02013 [Rugosibacter sp.]|nr:hypothetical protein [Rugosibacter sp.]